MNTSHELMEARLEEFERAVDEFRNDKMDGETFKSIRLPLGVYYQKPETSWMVRISIRGGRLSADIARYLAQQAERFEGVLHVTTRQNLQLHCVPLEEIPGLLWDLFKMGVVTYGASGDGIRSVKMPALNGLIPDRSTDLFPLLWRIEEYFLRHPLNMDLPRKFKITLANSDGPRINLKGEDLGLELEAGSEESTVRNQVYRVFAGGGLGAIAQEACCLVEAIEGEVLPMLLESMIRYFYDEGDRTNRNRARMKFLLKEKGEERFRDEILHRFQQIQHEEADAVLERFEQGRDAPEARRLDSRPATGCSELDEPVTGDGAIEQVSDGKYTQTLHTRLGDVIAGDFVQLADWAERFGTGEIRLGCDQNIYIPHLSVEQSGTVEVRDHFQTLSVRPRGVVNNVCPGVDYCDLGLTSSREIAEKIDRRARKNPELRDLLSDRRVNVSGCPNSCAWYQRGDVGLYGNLVKKNGAQKEAYSVHLSDDDGSGFSRCVERGVPAEDLPVRLEEIIRSNNP